MSFPSDLMILANKAAEEDESLPSKKATFFIMTQKKTLFLVIEMVM